MHACATTKDGRRTLDARKLNTNKREPRKPRIDQRLDDATSTILERREQADRGESCKGIDSLGGRGKPIVEKSVELRHPYARRAELMDR
jgi:hypothetical protein